MSIARAALALLAFITLASPAAAQSARETPLHTAERVADWQLAHLDYAQQAPDGRRVASKPRGWEQAAFWIGLTHLADRSGSPRFRQAILAQGASQEWRLGGRPYHADDHAIGAVWLWAAAHGAGPQARADVRIGMDQVVDRPSKVDLAFLGNGENCTDRWCWCDALFMAPPVLFELSRQTGDPKYAAFADREFRAATDFLFDRSEDLYFRDSRFFERRDPQGRKVFWSRGNGWVFAGLARILDILPPRDPRRPYYEAQYKRMAARLVTLQKPDGYWPPSLLSPEDSPPETSGTGFYVYGLAWGVKAGLLPRARYQPAVERGWAALARAVQPDGKLGWVQQISDRPDQVRADDTQFFGVGAFLLAASAVSDLQSRRATPSVVAGPPPRAMSPRANVAVAAERYGDLTWENDRTAYRIYSRALEVAEPPSGSGVDAWGKSVRTPFMEESLAGGRYHQNAGKGLDFFHVGQSRGDGGLGVWYDNKLWVSRNYSAYRIRRNGPDVADFEVDYPPWPVDVVRKVWETRRFTLPMGTNFTRLTSTIGSDSPQPLIVGVGLHKHATSKDAEKPLMDAAHGVLSTWSAGSDAEGAMGLALRFDPAQFEGFKEDADNYLVLLKVTPGQPFVYYLGSAWSRGQDFHTRADWDAYAAAQVVDFRP